MSSYNALFADIISSVLERAERERQQAADIAARALGYRDADDATSLSSQATIQRVTNGGRP